MDTMSRHLLIFFLLPKNGSILAPLTLTHKCRSLEIVPIVMGEKTLCEKEPCCREIGHRGALWQQRQSCSLFQVLSQGRCLSIASGWLGDGLTNKSLLFSHLSGLKPQNRQIGLSLHVSKGRISKQSCFPWRPRFHKDAQTCV